MIIKEKKRDLSPNLSPIYHPTESQIHLSSTQIKVLTLIRNNPNVTKPEMARITGASNGTVDNCISYLKKIGVIERIGSNKKGYWNILK